MNWDLLVIDSYCRYRWGFFITYYEKSLLSALEIVRRGRRGRAETGGETSNFSLDRVQTAEICKNQEKYFKISLPFKLFKVRYFTSILLIY